ncbi:hypothetical protein ACNTMW_22210 [Planosporangium sp. 12N6]|uniref:hypothetical protein n=1 Tax=Planosporangium spinosum TaxID=3402278 RepID=UPI003CEAF413
MSGREAGVHRLEPASVADTGAYLARLVRLDPAALVRLRPAGDGTVALWARLPFEVLVTRQVRAGLADDVTVRAADLLRTLDAGADRLPPRCDAQWRWPLPPAVSRLVERLPATEVHRVGAAAETTLRAAVAGGVRGRAVGERVLRDALLDHVPVVVLTDDGTRVEVPQRLVQAVVRMGFAGPPGAGGEVQVRVAGGWVGLGGEFGTGWYRSSRGFEVRPVGERSVTPA